MFLNKGWNITYELNSTFVLMYDFNVDDKVIVLVEIILFKGVYLKTKLSGGCPWKPFTRHLLVE